MSWQDRFLYAEAVAYLSYATLAIRFLSFRKIGRIAAVPLHGVPLESKQQLSVIRRVRKAIVCCAKQLPAVWLSAKDVQLRAEINAENARAKTKNESRRRMKKIRTPVGRVAHVTPSFGWGFKLKPL